jgi:hypothetical protein
MQEAMHKTKFKQAENREIPEGRIEIEGEKFSLLNDPLLLEYGITNCLRKEV